MYKDTITLFNRYTSEDGVIWQPHIIRNCDLNVDKASILKVYGADAEDNAKLHIKYNVEGEDIVIGKVVYKKPKEWKNLVKNELQDYVTFKNGKDFDFFVVGEYDTSVPIEDSDYMSSKYEGFYDYMNSKYDDIYTISSVGIYSVIPHIEILAR